MKHPEKWRETVNPYKLPYRNFTLTEVLGYPHAGNDVFHVRGLFQQREVEAFIKVARQTGADIANEIHTIQQLNNPLAPTVLDHDEAKRNFLVTLAKPGERLSTIVGDNRDRASLSYLFEYGQTLARLHQTPGTFPAVKDRKFFHIPDKNYFQQWNLQLVFDFLLSNRPQSTNRCFCHGDFHYANILWHNGHLSAILDFELSGLGNKEFDLAWALIRRPGQKFLNTAEEIDLFLNGYRSVGTFTPSLVSYYMVLIYSYFYFIGKNDPEYQTYVQTFLSNTIQSSL